MGVFPSCCCQNGGTNSVAVVVVNDDSAVVVVAVEVDPVVRRADMVSQVATDAPCAAKDDALASDAHTSQEALAKDASNITCEHGTRAIVSESRDGLPLDNTLVPSDEAFPQQALSMNDDESYLEQQWLDSVKMHCGVEPGEQLKVLDRFMQAIHADSSIPPVSHKLVALRFLRARKFDVEKALDMYKAAMRWRKEFAEPAMTEVISAEKASQLEKAYPSRLIGRDVQGRPCKVFDIGAVELRNSPLSADELVRHHIRQMELFSQALAWRDLRLSPPDPVTSVAPPLEGGLVIIDICNCNVGRFWNGLEFYKRMAAIDQNYYPEIMWKTVIVTRGHWAFDMAWGVVVKFLDIHTISKIEAISTKEPEKRLAELVPQDVLPPEYRSTKGKSATK